MEAIGSIVSRIVTRLGEREKTPVAAGDAATGEGCPCRLGRKQADGLRTRAVRTGVRCCVEAASEPPHGQGD